MFKRRPLGQNRTDNKTDPKADTKPAAEGGGFLKPPADFHRRAHNPHLKLSRLHQTPNPNEIISDPRRPQNQQGQGNRRPQRNNNRPQNAQGQGGRSSQPGQQPQGQRGPQNQNRPQPNQQQNRGAMGNRNQPQRNNNNRPRPEPRRAPPPPPPAYIQRDVLLIPASGSVEGIELVRTKFDPLAKKIPAHVTLIFPEPAEAISKDFLKNFTQGELPPLESITFTSVIVHEDMYLWLIPDDETKQKLLLWREALVKNLGENDQGEEFVPHLTLGYIPRSITPEDALTFAKTHITLPITLPLDKIMLEEFPENQISTQIDTFLLNPQTQQ